MKEKRLDIQGAFDYTGKMFEQIGLDFIRDIKRIPTFGSEVDQALKVHLDVMCNWPIGMEEWSFRSERYLGKQRLEIRKTRTVELAPEPLRRQYDLLMDHLDTTKIQLTAWSRIVRATGVSIKAIIGNKLSLADYFFRLAGVAITLRRSRPHIPLFHAFNLQCSEHLIRLFSFPSSLCPVSFFFFSLRYLLCCPCVLLPLLRIVESSVVQLLSLLCTTNTY